MSNPQPMTVRRRGAKRGEHGSYVAPAEVITAPAEPTSTVSVPTEAFGTDTSPVAARARRRTTSQTTNQSDATARAKAAYDARPKIIFRGVDDDTAAKLRAIYKHQLHQPGGVEGWSEWGRSILQGVVADYERAHGDMAGGEDVQLRAGRIAGT